MSQVLIIDNSRWLISAAARKIETALNLKVKSVQSYSEAVRLVSDEKSEFFIAIVGLCLKDAPDGAIVDLVLSKNIPAIVFTGKFDDNIRNNILSRKIVDYVLKRDPHSLDYIISLIRRIKRNQSIKVLVADDSSIARKNICGLLKVHQYKVFEACDGNEASRILDEHPDIRMVITDYYMPNMDGFELTKKIRHKFSKEELVIIGVSAWGYDRLSARFIKNGANDLGAALLG